MSVEEVFKAAPGCQKVLMAALEACRTPRTPSELDSIMDEVLRCNRSVYRPAERRQRRLPGEAAAGALRRAGIRTQRGRASGASCP